MVRSIGIDLIEVARIRYDLNRYGDRFARRILGPEEWTLFDRRRDKPLFLAGRFAAKEAVVKALGHYLTDRPPLVDLQVIADSSGQPTLNLPDHLRRRLSGSKCLISITHDKNYAAAVAVFVEE